ncbi:hypothetical protein OC844_004804 [Tilletia horrida]|nr:hypothetical protein OC844_004804 [Tilletia horrida]
MVGQQRHEAGGGASSGASSSGRTSRHSQHSAGVGAHHRNKSSTALSRASRSGSRTSLASHGRTNSSHRLNAGTAAAAAAGLTMTRTNSSGPAGPGGAAAAGGGGGGGGAKSASSAGSPPRRGIPPPKKPVKFTMGGDDDDEETDSDEWSEDDKSGIKSPQRTDTAAEDAPRIPDSKDKGKGQAQAADEVAEADNDDDGDDDDDDAWSSDEPTEEELRREAEAKAAEERERRRKEEEKRQRELFQKVEVPTRSASAADMTQLGRFGMSSLSNGNHRPGAMGPPLGPPQRSLLSNLFNSEQEAQIRAYRLSRMMGSQAEADQVRKAQIAAHASQPHLPQHAQDQARALAQAQAQARARASARASEEQGGSSKLRGQSQGPPRAQSRSRVPAQGSAGERDGPRRSASIISNSGMERGILRPSKSAVALPLLSKLELKSSTSAASGVNAPGSSYLRRTPSDAGSGSVGSGSRSFVEKGQDPILRLEPVAKDEPISESLSNRSLRKGGKGSSLASTNSAPGISGSTASDPSAAAILRSKSAERQESATPMQAPFVAAHRYSSTALNQLDAGQGYGGGPGGYEVMLPPGAIAQTPRTTRRNMLRDELSESVRANLLWERQSRSRRMGSSSAASGVGAAAYFASQQGGQVSRPASTGPGLGNGAGVNGGRPNQSPEGQGPGRLQQGLRPGQKNTVLSGDRLRPLTSSSNSSGAAPAYTTSPTERHPPRPGLGPPGVNQRTNSDNGPSSGGNSSDEDMYSDAARRRHTYDYNNSFHHKGW